MSNLTDLLSFLTEYDFLNLGMGGVELAALYLGVVVVLLAVIIFLIVKFCRGKKSKKVEDPWDFENPDNYNKAEDAVPEEPAEPTVPPLQKTPDLEIEQTLVIKKSDMRAQAEEESAKPAAADVHMENQPQAEPADDKKEKKSRRGKRYKFNSKTRQQWSAKMPESSVLLKYWENMDEDDRDVVGELSRNNDWCFEYMKQCGANEDSYTAVLTLWQYQGEKVDDLLKQMMRELADLHIEQSLAAVRMIVEIHDERIVPLLLLALLKMDKYPPARVAEALAAFGAVSARALTALYHKVEADQYKLIIMDALTQMDCGCPVSVVRDAMGCAEDNLRQKAAEVIGVDRPDDAVELLRPLLADPVGNVRAAAAASLGSLGGEEAYAILRQLIEKDPDWKVKSTCQNFITSWEKAICDKVAFDEVDEWLDEYAAGDLTDDEKQA